MSRNKQKQQAARQAAFRERQTEAGGRRLDVFISARASQGLERWKAYTGAQSDREAVELAILSAIMHANGG